MLVYLSNSWDFNRLQGCLTNILSLSPSLQQSLSRHAVVHDPNMKKTKVSSPMISTCQSLIIA